MRISRLKPVIVVATALGVLGGLAAPASAATATIEWVDPSQAGGFAVGTTLDHEWIPIPADPFVGDCIPLPQQDIDVSFSGTPTSGTWTAGGSFKTRFRLAPPNDAQLWQADTTVTAASGTYTTTGAPSGSTHALASSAPNHIIFTLALYRLVEPDCEKIDLACTVRTRVLLSAASGVDDAPSPGLGDEAVLVFTSFPAGNRLTVVSGSCPPTISSRLVGHHVAGAIHLNF